ncbi:MAG: purine-nucleoside phosphorylase [Bosea sp.]|jgi:purine-nucleoside phosphorylase|uniref:purine-nucleoside phosphorylase n=1 Tax=Bosea sp. (in: a-proteobacteria) TaxID=1871050 RepID=UPI00086935FE|nr:purine-nucleoside phosphorylase [Bosea sp. (in: a-proteobacteria)]MBN9449772.1 purine-nucleoside phosphorylase [Bosea sp. (in: a-proteobacteria)]MBN9470722.1 purine-nucleoside phosphorylase [Bosea sp. (in: a-proteobacteria)]ODT53754.1 MAG: purine-nucleoside phosphorylase [Methylobacterium sp. SCN 67-24]
MAADPLFDQAASVLIDRGIDGGIDCAIVLGTGLGRIVDDMTDTVSIPFAEVPGFPQGAVSGHARQVSYGLLHGKKVLVFEGRAHFYETGDPAIMRVPLGMLAAFGSPPLVLTNAAGSLRPDLRPGSLALITDHINLNGPNPLVGDTGDGRFVPMVDAYDPHLRARLKKAAATSGANMGEGVYMWFSGPSFETPAEIRMAKLLGADLVGMSTVPEVILARRHGLRVAGISIVTNMAAGMLGGAPSHGETRDVAAAATTGLRRVLRSFLTDL